MTKSYNSDDGWHEFMHQKPTPKQFAKDTCSIGVIGYSDQEYDKSKGAEYLMFSLFDMEDKLRYELGCNRFNLVSDSSNDGVSKEARTIVKHILGNDVTIIDADSHEFLVSLDGLIRIGGGKQELDEAKKFKEMYPEKPVIEHDL